MTPLGVVRSLRRPRIDPALTAAVRSAAAAFRERGAASLDSLAFASGGYGQLAFMVLAFAASAALGVAAALII